MSKDMLRDQLLERRNHLSNETRRELSLSISEHLLSALPADILQIGSYMAFGSEVDLQWLHHARMHNVISGRECGGDRLFLACRAGQSSSLKNMKTLQEAAQ